ncbi:MAG: recombinase family protein [Actinomycetota bacterium]|nr:recombinase family protein [Actinomycetota bacterium]
MRFQTVAYVRVSSVDQHPDRQVEVVGKVDRTFTDYLSGKSREDRPALGELLDYVREGDTVRVASMDRLARSVIDLAQLVGQCTDKGVSVEFVGEGLTFTRDTANPYAMFQLHMLGAVAQLERSLIRERQRQGIAIARGKKTYKGRLPVMTPQMIATARASVALKIPKAQIARDLGVSRNALYDALGSRGAYARSPSTAEAVGATPPVMAGARLDPTTVGEGGT